MSADAVSAALAALFRRVLAAPDLVLTSEMETGAHPHWDSIANVEILIACEECWGFEFSSAEIDKIRSFGDLTHAIVARVG